MGKYTPGRRFPPILIEHHDLSKSALVFTLPPASVIKIFVSDVVFGPSHRRAEKVLLQVEGGGGGAGGTDEDLGGDLEEENDGHVFQCTKM